MTPKTSSGRPQRPGDLWPRHHRPESTDNTSISIFGNSPYTSKITGGIGIVGGGTNRITQLQAINTGRLELLGSITSSANTFVRVGDNATTAVRCGRRLLRW
jgi:hypothetical protein